MLEHSIWNIKEKGLDHTHTSEVTPSASETSWRLQHLDPSSLQPQLQGAKFQELRNQNGFKSQSRNVRTGWRRLVRLNVSPVYPTPSSLTLTSTGKQWANKCTQRYSCHCIRPLVEGRKRIDTEGRNGTTLPVTGTQSPSAVIKVLQSLHLISLLHQRPCGVNFVSNCISKNDIILSNSAPSIIPAALFHLSVL